MDARQIRVVRAWREWSQVDLAERLQVTPNTVARWESEIRNPSGPARVVLGQLWEQVRQEIAESPADTHEKAA